MKTIKQVNKLSMQQLRMLLLFALSMLPSEARAQVLQKAKSKTSTAKRKFTAKQLAAQRRFAAMAKSGKLARMRRKKK